MIERNAGVPEDRQVVFRIGIHIGDVVEESDGDLMGDGVNIAARLEGIAIPGDICLSEERGLTSRSAILAPSRSRTSPSQSRSIRSRSAFRWRSTRPLRSKPAGAHVSRSPAGLRSPYSLFRT